MRGCIRRIVFLPLVSLLAVAMLAACEDQQPPTPTLTLTPEPTATQAPTPTQAPEPTVTQAPTPTPTPTLTLTPEPTATQAPTPTQAPEPTATQAPTPTQAPEPTATQAPTPTQAPEPTVTQAPTPTPTPTLTLTPEPTPSSPLGFGPGIYQVGKDIQSGIYAGRAGTEILDSCSWERLSGASGEFSDIIAIDNPLGQFYVEVFDTDKYFKTSCVLTPLTEWPAPDKPFSKIEIGTYIVGREISPGIYAGRAGTEILDSCSWERLSGASGEFSDIIAIDNPLGQFYVEVFDTDKYFKTSCVLTPLTEWPAPDKPFSKIEIGTYIVGREISPGIYAGRAGTEILDSCSWERLSGASGEFSDIIAIDNPLGQFYVEVFDTDKYFKTSCALELDLTKTSGTTNGAEYWRGLAIAPEDRCSPYDPDDYPYSQSVEQQIVANMGGIIYGPYTGSWFDSTSDTDIEHIVARSEAHDSGLCAADVETRRQFASDLLNLTLASPAVNRSQKSGKDVAEWLPDVNRCWFASRTVEVRQRYGLTIDERERDALESILSGCTSTEMIVQEPPPDSTATPAPKDEEVSSALEMYDDNGNGRISCAEARSHGIAPVHRGHPAYEYMNDADDDGVVCE